MKLACAWGGFVFALLLVISSQAMAQTRVCTDRSTLLERFEARFHEAPVARALMHSGGVLEVLSTADGATWSVMVTLPNGTSCIVAAGRYWQVIHPPMPGDGT
ncbi:MAG: hypothetical protein ACTSX7_00125 [Alphaproteobacteria bacterium]